MSWRFRAASVLMRSGLLTVACLAGGESGKRAPGTAEPAVALEEGAHATAALGPTSVPEPEATSTASSFPESPAPVPTAASDSPARPPAVTPPPVPTRTATGGPPTIVLDPGHGGPADPGASSLALIEKNSNLEALHAQGYEGGDRGLQDDSCFRYFNGRCFQLFVLGPPRETRRDEVIRRGGDPAALGFAPGQDVIWGRPTEMPGALVELLFISHEDDNAFLRQEAVRAAMAQALVNAINGFFATAN